MAAQGGDNDMCWICLEEAAEDGSHQLVAPCKCPRKVHPQCLARWQLQQAGRHEEKFCRFCNNELADWKRHLTPEELKPEVSKVQPIMVVYFEGQIHRIPVKQGPDGLDEFTGKIRELFRLPDDVDISLTFGCKEPMSGSHLKLEGMGAFDAAVHCASVAAADRQQKIKKSYSTGNLGSTPALADGNVPRSASINNMGSGAHSPSDAPATPPSAAGASAASAAAQDRRQRFPAQQQPPNTRSRSFSTFSTPRSAGAEQPAAFRNILGMLNGAPGSAQAPQGAGAGASPTPMPQASPRAGLPPPSPVRFAEPPAAVTAAAAPAGQRVQQSASMRRERLSLRQVSELKDVPEADETVAVGSLSGKFKLHLKAFSRKVARSLSFTSGKSAGGAGSSMSTAASMEQEFASAGSSFSINSNSSSRVGSYTAPSPPLNVAAAAQYGRGPSPLPPATPPSIYSH